VFNPRGITVQFPAQYSAAPFLIEIAASGILKNALLAMTF